MENKAHRRVHKKRGGLIATIVAAVVAIVAIGCVVIFSTYEATTIADKIYVHDLHLGGMDAQQAIAALEAEFGSDYFDKKVKITYDGSEFEVGLLGVAELDARDTVGDALGVSNNLIKRIFSKKKIVLPFDLEVDDDKLEEELAGFAALKEEDYGIFAFNKDYTSVDVNTTNVEKILDAQRTAGIIIRNAENNDFSAVEAVLTDKNSEDFAEEVYRRLDRPATNASVGMYEDGTTYIVPEQVGVKADQDLFEDLFAKHKGVFTMDIKPVEPEITTMDLDIEFYQDVLGSYTSTYNAGLVNRTKNVTLAASLVNGTVVMPGHRFSYNGVVGKRTYERGFVDATVYTGEGTEEGIGGGICQVSSTLYCAQLRADLKTVSRTNHSYTVVYVPHGQDATVVYGAIDYIFENDTNYPIKILANANGGYLTVKIMGTKVDKSVTVDVVSVTEATYNFGEVTKESPELPLGTTKVDQNGQIGARVSTYKVYYKNGIEQNREFVTRSNYKAMNKIVLVGTGEAVEAENTEDVENVDDAEITEPADKPMEEEVTDVPVNNEVTGEDTEEEATDEMVEQPELSDSGL